MRIALRKVMTTIPPPQYVDAALIASWMKDPANNLIGKDFLVVDVRDDDFIGGNIRGARNIPVSRFLNFPEEVAAELKDAKKVVFHCALSQVRGPKSANVYYRTLTALAERSSSDKPTKTFESKTEQILILRGGFSMWQAAYKDDPDLVERYDAELWSSMQ